MHKLHGKIHNIFGLVLKNIREMLLHAQIGVIFLAFAIMVFFSYRYVSNVERKHLYRDIQDTLTTAQVTIVSGLHEPETVLIGLSQTLKLLLMSDSQPELIRGYIETTVNEIVSNDNSMTGYGGVYGIFDSMGGIYIDSLKRELPEGYVPEERPWYKAAVDAKGKIAATAPYIGYSSDYFVITYARQILDDSGNQLGILCIDVEMNDINKLVIGLNIKNNGYGILVDSDYRLISHPNKDFLGKNIFECNERMLSCKTDMDNRTDITEKIITDS